LKKPASQFGTDRPLQALQHRMPTMFIAAEPTV